MSVSYRLASGENTGSPPRVCVHGLLSTCDMNASARRQHFFRTIQFVLRGGVAACALAVLPCHVFAQTEDPGLPLATQEDPPVPTEPMKPPTTVQEAETMMGALYPDNGNATEQAPANPEGEPTRPWKLTLQAGASAIYDTNIFIAPRHPQADLLFTVSPGIKFAWGDWLAQQGNFLVAAYTLSGLLFVAHPGQDTIEQQGSLDAQWRLARLTLAMQFRFQDLSSANVDVGNRTRRLLYDTALLNKYELSEKTYLEANLYNHIADYSTEISSTEWIARFWFNYRPTPKLTVGSGASVGYLDVEHSPGQTFEQGLLRASYSATEKLSFEAYGGVELRQLETGDRAFPVLDISGSYRPFEATELKLTAYRKVQNSALLAGENYTVTGVTIEASRSVRAGWDLVLAGGYNYGGYSAASQRRATAREDSYFFVRPALRFEMAHRLHAEVFYLYQQNDSTYAPTAFHDAQVGALVRFDY